MDICATTTPRRWRKKFGSSRMKKMQTSQMRNWLRIKKLFNCGQAIKHRERILFSAYLPSLWRKPSSNVAGFFAATRNRRPVEQQRMKFDLCESQFQRGLRGSSSPNNQAMAGCQRNGAGSGGRGGSVSNVSSSGMAPGYSAAAAVRARTSRV